MSDVTVAFIWLYFTQTWAPELMLKFSLPSKLLRVRSIGPESV